MRRSLAARLSGLAVPLGAAAALLLSVGPAHAGTGYGQLIVNPGTAAPGQTVSILGTCPNNGQGFNGVQSSAFVGGSASMSQSSINFSGTATIAPGASGTYTVTAQCGAGSPTVNITVSGSAVAPPTTQPANPNPPASSSAMTQNTAAAMPPAATSKAAMGGMNQNTAKPASPTASGGAMAMGAAGMQAMSATPGMSAAGNGPVTSTGIVRVGLAGSSRSAFTTAGAAVIAVALALAGGVGFLMIRRRRNTPGTHI